jgi:hypothetical protein
MKMNTLAASQPAFSVSYHMDALNLPSNLTLFESVNAVSTTKQQRNGHTQTMPAGPAGIENERVEAIDGNRPMILKAMANTSTVE